MSDRDGRVAVDTSGFVRDLSELLDAVDEYVNAIPDEEIERRIGDALRPRD